MKSGWRRAAPFVVFGAVVVPAILFVGSCAAERSPEFLWVRGLDVRLSPGGESVGGTVRWSMRMHALPVGEEPLLLEETIPKESKVEEVWLPLDRTLLLRVLREHGLYGTWMHYRPTGAEERCDGATWQEFRAVGVDGEILVGLGSAGHAGPGWRCQCWHR